MNRNEENQQEKLYFFTEDTPKEEIQEAVFEKRIPIVTGTAGYAKKQIMNAIMEEALEREQNVLLISENVFEENVTKEDFKSQLACVHEQVANADFIKYDEISDEEKEQILPLAKSTLHKYENLWNITQTLRNYLQSLEHHLEESSEKEVLQQIVAIAKIIKKCPIYEKNIKEILQKPQSDNDSLKEELLYQLEELSNLKHGKPKYNKKKEKIINKFLSRYEAGEIYNLFRDLAENKKETLERINQLEIFCNEDGTVYLGKISAKEREEQSAKFYKFLQEVAYSLEEETKDVQKLVQEVIAKIVLGEKQELKALSEELTSVYAEYVQAQSQLSEKILKNQDAFATHYPNLLKKVLFETWVNKYENDLYKAQSCLSEMYRDIKECTKKGWLCERMMLSDVKSYTFSDFPKYDIVLIENGLQMSLCDALIPMSKAKCCVIFADEKDDN